MPQCDEGEDQYTRRREPMRPTEWNVEVAHDPEVV